MLSPLLAQPDMEGGGLHPSPPAMANGEQGASKAKGSTVCGWSLRLVMEYCDNVGAGTAGAMRSCSLHLEGPLAGAGS